MKIGVLVHLGENVDETFKKVADLGLDNCQLACWDGAKMTDANVEAIAQATKKYGIEISAFWCGWSGPAMWNFYEGPLTLGIVPEAHREIRCRELKQGSDFAKKLGIRHVITHLGFLPEIPLSEEYPKIVEAVRDIALHMKENGQYFLFETGQETPVTLKRLITDAKTDNLGINLDPANLILYGKANPIDALDVFGEYVMGVHAKDGKYPTNAKQLGEETPIGEGRVNFPQFIQKLREVGYDGALTIEREISGEKQKADILASIDYIKSILGGLSS
ncbi:MAG: sugar phosphate isomerase/epimerase [Clostridia bacterium]|nr:sugar phosphate isomerase/epimerase [Clostridia bacterium]